MTAKPVRTRLSPTDRRAQLIRHAIGSFADHGIARATQAQVAARAGVSVSAVYSYFRTRGDLVEAVLDAVAAEITAMVAGALSTAAPLPTALGELARRTAAMAVDDPDLVRVWLDWSTGVRADTWPTFLLLQRRLQGLVETMLLQGQPGAPVDAVTRSAARLFVGGAHTLALMRFENIDAAALELFIEQMVGGVLAACQSARLADRTSA
jgi:TetR/AcrR family transcriptional regulator, hemagglutinin/protease regulatory protein